MKYRHDRFTRRRNRQRRVIAGSVSVVFLTAVAITQMSNGNTWAALPIGNQKVRKPSTQVTKVKGSTHPAGQNSTKPPKTAPQPTPPPSDSTASTDCNNGRPIHSGLATAVSAQLRALASYESVCSAGIIDTVSFFAPTPTTQEQATSYANDMAIRLQDFARHGIKPLVFLEPTAEGAILNFETYRSGAYDVALEKYFAAVKALGITDATMGTWVFFPEGNIPVWNDVSASRYATNVTKTAQHMKEYFPAAKAAVLLDSMTYPSDTSWSGGRYVSLAPYIKDIPKGLIDSFGLQGFPWTPPANEAGVASFDPNAYLQTSIAGEAARILGVSEVWLNTGTFSRAYATNPAKTVVVEPAKRADMLRGVVAQANNLRTQGFSVAIHLFSEDKSQTSEGIDWSYWNTNQTPTGPSVDVFRAFAHQAQSNNLPLWLFDVKP